ncbi:hypothetical protein V1498_15935 [Peribacillus sp. SCS-26]|uniref:hypothetical protein n=1 Tax=Paraperibacillus marinus TaxID=3115295 RepID=UPI0039058946
MYDWTVINTEIFETVQISDNCAAAINAVLGNSGTVTAIVNPGPIAATILDIQCVERNGIELGTVHVQKSGIVTVSYVDGTGAAVYIPETFNFSRNHY